MNENIVVKTDEEELTTDRWETALQQFINENHPTESAELQATYLWEKLAIKIEP